MKFASYWSLQTYANGRQVWQFLPPAPFDEFGEKDWETETGQGFLKEMAAEFSFNKNGNPSSSDAVFRQQKLSKNSTNNNGKRSEQGPFLKAACFYKRLQADSGNWPGDYGGPLFLLPGLIIAAYVTETVLPAPHRSLMKQYMLNHQNADGGWGLHIEGASTMFGTVLQYVSLRILGTNASDGSMELARAWVKKNGGATGVPLWGKFYLALLGVYEWEGINSLFPELFLLPESLPVHPSNYWCHARMVYLPMAYCYGEKMKAKPSPLLEELKEELYLGLYEDVDWKVARNKCAATDLYYPQSNVLKVFNKAMNIYEQAQVKAWRKQANDFALAYINAEDEQTNFIDIGPVNQAINSVCVWHAYGKGGDRFKKHVERWFDYLWLAEDGMKMNGYNGSQLWDTAFAAQAIMEGEGEKDFAETLIKANRFIVNAQVKEEVKDHKKFFRHNSVGGWPFSTNEHGWPITDCTAEGLKTTLIIRSLKLAGPGEQMTDEMLKHAADLILSFQNKKGGWASYELTRGPEWLEALNPSEVFGNIMIDYAYTECTSACVQALLRFKAEFPDHKKVQIEEAVKKGAKFILQQQREDGSWYGSWAVCFTYGIWFATEALAAALKSDIKFADRDKMKEALNKAAVFLISKQQPDGGWGESFESCITKQYIQHKNSQVVNTSWALLSLMVMGHTDKAVIERGIELIKSRQLDNGDFAQEGVSGVFNHNCAITYTSYRNVFPIWALGRYKTKYGERPAPLANTNLADIETKTPVY